MPEKLHEICGLYYENTRREKVALGVFLTLIYVYKHNKTQHIPDQIQLNFRSNK